MYCYELNSNGVHLIPRAIYCHLFVVGEGDLKVNPQTSDLVDQAYLSEGENWP